MTIIITLITGAIFGHIIVCGNKEYMWQLDCQLGLNSWITLINKGNFMLRSMSCLFSMTMGVPYKTQISISIDFLEVPHKLYLYFKFSDYFIN